MSPGQRQLTTGLSLEQHFNFPATDDVAHVPLGIGPTRPVACREVPGRDTPAAYSITSSAWASTDAGRSSPSAFAVLRLMTSSYLVGVCTGRSAGFSPLRIRST